MLVLKRSVNQKTFLRLPTGETIEVIVTESGYGWARLGFVAPEKVAIEREEAKQKEAS